MKHRVEKY